MNSQTTPPDDALEALVTNAPVVYDASTNTYRVATDEDDDADIIPTDEAFPAYEGAEDEPQPIPTTSDEPVIPFGLTNKTTGDEPQTDLREQIEAKLRATLEARVAGALNWTGDVVTIYDHDSAVDYFMPVIDRWLR